MSGQNAMLSLTKPDRIPAQRSRRPARFAILLIAAAVFALPAALAAQGVIRIVAIVNEDVISAYDLGNRVRMVIATTELPDDPETRRRLTNQVLRNMIDERLQMQEANRLNVRVTDKEIDDLLANLNQQNRLPPGSLEQLLERANVNVDALRAKLRAEHAWNKLIRQRLQSQVFIGDEEVEEELQRLKTVQHLPRHRVAEIFLAVDKPENDKQVLDLANRLMDQIRNGARFPALAREFSQSASAAVGGDLGWVTKGQLESVLDNRLQTMKQNEVAGPIRAVAGYHILLLIERVTPKATAGGGARIDITQAVLPLSPNPTRQEVEAQLALAREVRGNVQSCDDMRGVIKSLNSPKSGDVTGVKLDSLPAEIQSSVTRLKVGETSEPIRVAEGVLLATLCRRDEGTASGLPTRTEIINRLGTQRFNLLVQRYMRDLRRTAFVDIRG
ncbi:MAG: peptidylprolyl isomerase [Alphaproteobacteria bacterium]|nr:peptidylprolyl isomerase [Alphaproteobacteria bacterium]